MAEMIIILSVYVFIVLTWINIFMLFLFTGIAYSYKHTL